LNSVKPEAQFSIYKIDFEKVIADFFSESISPKCDDILIALTNSIENLLKEKENCKGYSLLISDDYQGFVFKTYHIPDWKDLIQQLIINNKNSNKSDLPSDFLFNKNISYILFKMQKDSIYVMTGGYGSFLVTKYVEKNYGLYLLPKIVKKENPVVKNIIENNLTGNRASTQRFNRSNTSFISEQDLSSIYKQLNVEINRELAELLGISFEDNEPANKKINLINKDSLVIRRSFSLSKLAKIITKLNKLEKQPDNFALNYLVLAKKIGFKREDLIKQLVENFKKEDYKSFVLIGDDLDNYIFNADYYRILKENGEIFLESTSPITLDDLFQELRRCNIRLTSALIGSLLKKWQIETRDKNGHLELNPQSLIYTLQGFIEVGSNNQPCHLINGEWYVFDDVYSGLLNKTYKELFELKVKTSTMVIQKFNLRKTGVNEAAYNAALKAEKNIIVSHKALHHNVEIADAIFWDDTTLYLMHNKGTFNGIGSRDLLNQILTAAEYLQKNRLLNGTNFLEDYYEQICKINNTKSLKSATKSEFVQLFTNKKICFIAGFLKGYKINSRSTYAKYLMIEADKKLSDKGYDYIPMGIK
jgi:hypothetical protein